MIETAKQFLDACHPFGYPLLICSVTLIAAILYHLIFTGEGRALRSLQQKLAVAKMQNSSQVLLESALSSKAPLAREVIYCIEHRYEPDIEKLIEARLRLIMDRQRAGMSLINIVTTISPMLGILGTAWGLVEIFGVFGTTEAQSGISLGISKALYTTIFGLAIAVPGIVALSCFERSLERRSARVAEFFTDLLAHRNRL
ncbi:MAG TPA: MotA/TolQ/ExbB proton channel family protein [Candidatus Akkermansia intestinavium]|nr:MotA/TolQ/ExbB proton channel family protein [Candidatus Akkermansia intestinavium]